MNRESGIGCSWTPVGSSAVNPGPVARVGDGALGHPEDGIRQPLLEPLVVCELLEKLHVVVEHGSHHAPQGFVMLDPGVVREQLLPPISRRQGTTMGTRVPRNTQAPLTLFGWRSTASHVSQFVIWSLHFHTAYVYLWTAPASFSSSSRLRTTMKVCSSLTILQRVAMQAPSSSDGSSLRRNN